MSPNKTLQLNDVVIVSAVRTPIGSFQGALSPLSAPQFASVAIKAAVERCSIPKEEIKEVILGQVLQAGSKQSPARQAALHAGLSKSTICTTVNKVCASGMKAVTMAVQTIQTGHQDVCIGGGMESLSNVPYNLKRGSTPYGGITLDDGILADGYNDAYTQYHAGKCAENIAAKMNITREMQDEYAATSYRRAQAANEAKLFEAELVSVPVPQQKGPDRIFSEDEEYKRFNYEKMCKLPPAFQENGTITAANASGICDGAAILILTSMEAAKRLGLKPLARVLGYADAATEPIDFPIAIAQSIPGLLAKTGYKKEDIALWEINEAFSTVTLANQKLLDLDLAKLNIHGGAVSLGHPLAMSGARIVVHLVHSLKTGEVGIASACNGGGGASTIMIEKL